MTQRTPLIVGNWKMNHTVAQTQDFFSKAKKQFANLSDTEVVVCPPFTALSGASSILPDAKNLALGAQNCHWELEGAYTGEISPLFLKEIGCQYVLLGHSERRHVFGETNEMIGRKTKSVLKCGLNPIVCVGETLKERQENQTLNIIQVQLEAALGDCSQSEMNQVTLAYEPVWAIGTGQNATPKQAQEVHVFIRKWVGSKFDSNISSKIRILYGGSVKPDNTQVLMNEVDIDGVLVGGASLNLDSFEKIVQYRQHSS